MVSNMVKIVCHEVMVLACWLAGKVGRNEFLQKCSALDLALSVHNGDVHIQK